ncbi:MAG: AAA family ATPase [Oscillospiraceae bacterium]
MMVDTNPDDVKDSQTRLEMVRYEAVDKYGIPEDEFARWLGDMNDLWLKDEASFRQCETSGKSLDLVKASVVTYEPPRWLIPPYFQRGKGTLIQGDNGSGKTAFMCAIAAHVSTGRPLLGIPIEGPGPVLILSVEDDLPILRGRIEANGGDLDKCYFLGNAADLTFNSPEVEAAIQRSHAVMVIFDPFQAFLGAKVDMFRANEVRPVLAKLFDMCERNSCSCAIIAHMGKGGSDKSPVNRSLGSVDIPAAMRSILQLIRNPEKPEECIMVHIKCSNAPLGRGLSYTIGDRGGVTWNGFNDMSLDELATVKKRTEKGIPYEHEPLVQVFNQLVTDKPGGGFWSYADLKSEGAKILGFPPFSDSRDLTRRLDDGLAKELQAHDGLIVTSGARRNNARGVRIEQYQQPQGYQTKLLNGQ